MDRCQNRLLVLSLTAVIALNTLGNNAEIVEQHVTNLTSKLLRVIPPRENKSSVTKLILERNLISLSESDRSALATYSNLTDLHLDENLVIDIGAKYFSVVPHLRVLSLSWNNISSLDPEAFSGLDDLRKLDLSHNLLTNLPVVLLQGLKHLQVLNLQENPWNCLCELLQSIRDVKEAGISFAAPHATCASPEELTGTHLLEATSMCFQSNTDSPKPPLTSTMPRPALTSNQSSNNSRDQTPTPVLGNTWKFTACVAALALTTSILIVCAVKGPSWYKILYNYRHHRLHQADEGDDGEKVASTAFSQHWHHQTYSLNERMARGYST
uniref:LRRCT domain-containing protein n=1 Tax=Sphaeramia orbicularis TaxID=375764 RepID=A0A673AJB5_9TELE